MEEPGLRGGQALRLNVGGPSIEEPGLPEWPGLNPGARIYMMWLEKHFAYQGSIKKTEHRSMSVAQLERVFGFLAAHCHLWHDTSPPEVSWSSGQNLTPEWVNLYHANEWLIKPATALARCSFVELLTAAKQKPDWYASHWWGEPVQKFVACVKAHVVLRGMLLDSKFWVCAYANKQHCLDQEFADDPRHTSFFKAMALSAGILLILDGKTEHTGPATPFTRIWCAFEEYVALEYFSQEGQDGKAMFLDIATSYDGEVHFLTRGVTHQDTLSNPHDEEYAKAMREASFPLDVIEKGLVLELEKAQATEESDRRHILNCIAGRELSAAPLEVHANYTKVNKRLRSFFAEVAFRQAADKDKIESLNLSEVLAADVWRESLTLDFSCCGDNFSDECLEALAKGLCVNLRSLSLTFAYCENITSIGVEALARRLPVGLRTLILDFSGCQRVGDVAVAALLRHRPPLLQTQHSMAIFRGTDIRSNTLWDFSSENLDRIIRSLSKEKPANRTDTPEGIVAGESDQATRGATASHHKGRGPSPGSKEDATAKASGGAGIASILLPSACLIPSRTSRTACSPSQDSDSPHTQSSPYNECREEGELALPRRTSSSKAVDLSPDGATGSSGISRRSAPASIILGNIRRSEQRTENVLRRCSLAMEAIRSKKVFRPETSQDAQLRETAFSRLTQCRTAPYAIPSGSDSVPLVSTTSIARSISTPGIARRRRPLFQSGINQSGRTADLSPKYIHPRRYALLS